jgi:hypothetical protein
MPDKLGYRSPDIQVRDELANLSIYSCFTYLYV